MTFNSRPWEVSLEEYKALEASIKPDDRLIKLAIKLTKRLGGRKYGHVVAYLYREWAHAQGLEATLAWWKEYEAQQWQAHAEDAEVVNQANAQQSDMPLFAQNDFDF